MKVYATDKRERERERERERSLFEATDFITN